MDTAENAYRAQVTQEYNALGFAGFGRAAPGPHQLRLDQVRLEDIFVRLHLTVEQDEPRQHSKLGEDRAARAPDERQQKRDKPITLAEALNKPLLLVGEPGAGKSTLLRWLAVTFAQGHQRNPDRIGSTADADRLPILIELGRLPTTYLTDESRQFPDWQMLLPEEITRQERFRSTSPDLLQAALKAGRCLLLFDGLDEIANRQARARLAQSLAQVPVLFPGNRVVVGTRPAGLTGESEGALRPTFQRCQIQRFTPEDLQRFFRFWYALDPTLLPDAHQREADALYERITAAPGTLRLAGTPLLATLLLLIWHKEGALPERRVDLYERCCRMLVEDWEQSHDVADRGIFADLGWEQHLHLLASIAYEIHRQEQRTSISREDLRKLLEESLLAGKLCHPDTVGLEATRFLEALALRSGLLQFQGDGQYGFPHLTVQEYLAARHLAAQPDPAPLNEVMEHLHEAWWQEVHLLTIGRLGSGPEGAAQASDLLRAILRRYRPPNRLLRRPRHWWLELITPGRWLSQVQLVRRLAWLLRREEIFALWGAAECAPNGLQPTLCAALAARAAALTRTLLFESLRRELRYHWLDAPEWRLPPQATEAVIAVHLAALREGNWFVRGEVAERLGRIGRGQPAVVQALLDTALHDRSWRVRPTAVWSLGQVGSGQPAVIQALLVMALHDTDREVCRLAVESLGQVGRGQPAVIQALLAALHDTDEHVRLAAVESLEQVGRGQPAVIQALLAALHDTDLGVRLAAVESLEQVGSGQPAVIQALLEVALHDIDRHVRGNAAESLEQVGRGQPAVIDALLVALRDGDWFVRRTAARSLGKVGNGQPAVIQALLAALRNTDEGGRAAAAWSLGKVGGGQPAVTQALLEAALHDTNRDVRWAAVWSLGEVSSGQPAVFQVLLELALHDTDEHARSAAVWNLGKVGGGQPVVIQALLAALNDIDAWVRQAAAQSLGQVGGGQPAVIQALLAALHDADWDVRKAAKKSLEEMGSRQPEVIQALLAALRNTDEGGRAAAVESLGQVGRGQPAVVQALLEVALHDTAGEVRRLAVESLGQVGRGQPAVVQALLAILDTDAWVHQAAAQSLGQVGRGQPAVVQALLAALNDTDMRVRRAAAESLGQMKITDAAQLRLALAIFNRRLYDWDENERKGALEAISRLVAGRALPGSRWKPVLSEQERTQRRKRTRVVLAAGLGVLAAILGVTWLSGIPPFTTWFAALGSVVALLAALGTILGVTLRDLLRQETRPNT